jgi:ABC-type Fe3+-hydroxamate transport system substrate-binding protein
VICCQTFIKGVEYCGIELKRLVVAGFLLSNALENISPFETYGRFGSSPLIQIIKAWKQRRVYAIDEIKFF